MILFLILSSSILLSLLLSFLAVRIATYLYPDTPLPPSVVRPYSHRFPIESKMSNEEFVKNMMSTLEFDGETKGN